MTPNDIRNTLTTYLSREDVKDTVRDLINSNGLTHIHSMECALYDLGEIIAVIPTVRGMKVPVMA